MWQSILTRSKRDLQIFAGACFLVCLLMIALGTRIGWTWDFMEPFIGFVTLIVAVFIWYGEKKQDYLASLEKRLTVIFLYPHDQAGNAHPKNPSWRRIAIFCEQAYLASESDLRAWSQQVAGNMVFDNILKFRPFIREEPGRIERDGEKTFMHYHTIFDLRKVPAPNDRGDTESTECQGAKNALENNRTVCWLRQPCSDLEIRHDQTRWFDSATCQIHVEENASA